MSAMGFFAASPGEGEHQVVCVASARDRSLSEPLDGEGALEHARDGPAALGVVGERVLPDELGELGLHDLGTFGDQLLEGFHVRRLNTSRTCTPV